MEREADLELGGFGTPPLREYPEQYAKYQIHQPELESLQSLASCGNKRVRPEESGTTPKRKASSDYLRKGQWTATEERLARLLIEAFEEGYLPIYTGIRLRGYLAVQLQCDPMRVSKKLCAGTIDGKAIPRNYGQKKFKLRKKQMWDRDEAGKILETLEMLTKELWKESGISQPKYLSLSSTKTEDDGHSGSPHRSLSPSKSKRQKSVLFPIIYLNISKTMKTPTSDSKNAFVHGNSSSDEGVDPVNDEDKEIYPSFSRSYIQRGKSCTSSSVWHGNFPDVESIKAAKELLELYHHDYSSAEIKAASEFVGNFTHIRTRDEKMAATPTDVA
jgi:hypothetical protein